METLTTNGVKISVETFYHHEYSVPTESNIFFAYRISIENLNGFQVQLLRRYWMIEDSNGEKREVRGDGVIGQQPILGQGQNHAYISGCPLKTGIGRMYGHFTFVRMDTNEEFQVDVPIFDMVAPFIMN